jgi:hypothetical protein
MRKALAAAVLAAVGAGTGCCKTCSWCQDTAPPARTGYVQEPAPPGTPLPGGAPTGTAAPAGVPTTPRAVGAYGGTGN